MRVFTIALAFLATSMFAHADPTVNKFVLWGQQSTFGDKFNMYLGWSNGYFAGYGPQAFPLRSCIEGSIPYQQAVAMIDKYYDDHPEKWGFNLSDEIVEALTVAGGPCSGKAPK